MKKTLIILSTLLVFLYSCKDKENILELDIPKTDPESKIADLENSGVKLFKRNLKIADATGDNFVIVQVASENESTLNNYLQGTTFRLTLGDVFQKIDNIQSSTSTNIKPSTDNIDIYDVVLFKKIDSKYKSYTIKYQHSTQKNARIKDVNNYTKNTWHESNRFDDWMNVTWFSVGASEEVLTVIWKHLNCALCSWDTDDYVGLYAGNQSSTHSPDARRLGCRVHHNFYNYNVTYGNY